MWVRGGLFWSLAVIIFRLYTVTAECRYMRRGAGIIRRIGDFRWLFSEHSAWERTQGRYKFHLKKEKQLFGGLSKKSIIIARSVVCCCTVLLLPCEAVTCRTGLPGASQAAATRSVSGKCTQKGRRNSYTDLSTTTEVTARIRNMMITELTLRVDFRFLRNTSRRSVIGCFVSV